MADRTGGLRGAWSEVIALLPTPRCFTCRLTICGLQYSQCSDESIWTSHIKSCKPSTLPWLERVPKVPPGKEQTKQTTLPRQLLQSPPSHGGHAFKHPDPADPRISFFAHRCWNLLPNTSPHTHTHTPMLYHVSLWLRIRPPQLAAGGARQTTPSRRKTTGSLFSARAAALAS